MNSFIRFQWVEIPLDFRIYVGRWEIHRFLLVTLAILLLHVNFLESSSSILCTNFLS